MPHCRRSVLLGSVTNVSHLRKPHCPVSETKANLTWRGQRLWHQKPTSRDILCACLELELQDSIARLICESHLRRKCQGSNASSVGCSARRTYLTWPAPSAPRDLFLHCPGHSKHNDLEPHKISVHITLLYWKLWTVESVYCAGSRVRGRRRRNILAPKESPPDSPICTGGQHSDEAWNQPTFDKFIFTPHTKATIGSVCKVIAPGQLLVRHPSRTTIAAKRRL